VSARRYSGEVRIELTLVPAPNMPHGEQYRCDISLRGVRLGTQYVGIPAHLEHAIDSPEAFDAAARAALSFAVDEEERGERDWRGFADHCELGPDGWIVRCAPCVQGAPFGTAFRRALGTPATNAPADTAASGMVLHVYNNPTGTNDTFDGINVWVTGVPADFNDADVRHNVEQMAGSGDRVAVLALQLIAEHARGEWVGFASSDPTVRVYVDK
jgi:hypothetical protein